MSCVCPHVCGLLTPGYDDCEGDLLASIRELVGPNVLISSELDPHSHLTQKRFDAADILIAFKEFSHGTLLAGASATLPSVIRHCAFARSALYPANFRASYAVDFVERAEEVVELSLRTIRGEIKPVMSKFDCKMVEVCPTSQVGLTRVHPIILCPSLARSLAHLPAPLAFDFLQEPMRSFIDRIMLLEAHSELSSMSKLTTHVPGPDPSVLSISCIHGFMPADVEGMGSHILVITDDNAAKGATLAEELGMELFSLRGTTRPQYRPRSSPRLRTVTQY